MRLHHVRRGTGEPLVLLHGVGDSHRTWGNVMGQLARAHEVIAVDLPGFGVSRTLRDAAPSPSALAVAVVTFMGGERFHVAGNSLGGGIALELGRTDRALSVTCLSPIGFAEGWERAYLRRSLDLTHLAGRILPRGLMGSPAVRRATTLQTMVRPMGRDDLVATLDALALAPGWDATLPELVRYRFTGAVGCPTTIAWGEHDRLLLHRQAARARRALPQARHVTLTGCGHLPAWDDPEQVARVILETTG